MKICTWCKIRSRFALYLIGKFLSSGIFDRFQDIAYDIGTDKASEAQRDVSIEQQKEAAKDYCDRNKLKIIKEYADRAISGARDDRPEFMMMLSEVKRMRPAYLVLWKTDRLSRDRVTSTIAKKQLRDNGVKIVYVAEPIPDNDEATEVLLESIYEGMAQSFLLQHRKNVMRGLDYNAEHGLYNGVTVLGYKGKPDSPYEIDDSTAPVVIRIFKEYASGIPMKKIIDGLNGSGIKTSKGKDFTINSIRAILQNRSYIGEYRWGEHFIPDGMPRIISDELFEAAQAQLAKNKRGGGQAERRLVPETTADYWLTGKLFCGECGASMQGVSGTSRHGYKCYYYYCSGHRKKLCNTKNVRRDVVEEIVLHVLDSLVNDTALQFLLAERCYNYYKSEHGDRGAYIASIEASIKETEKKYENIMKAN